MSLAYIQKYYGVPAKRGGRVEYESPLAGKEFGTITGAEGQYLRIRMDGRKHSMNYHPTYNLTYLPTPSQAAETGAQTKGEK
jgi:hypothetical protein